MDKNANLFLYDLYKRMPIAKDHPYFNLSPEELYNKHRFCFEFYEDNYSDILSMKKDVRILDVGFGFGMFMVYMKKNGFNDIFGVEYNKTQVINGRNMKFQVEEISDLRDYLKNNISMFDLIHISNALEHFPKYDLIEIFDLLYGALKDNGKLAVVVPNIAGYRGAYNRYLVLGHEIGFSEASLEQLFEVSNFSNVRVFGTRIGFRFRIKHMLMRIGQGIFNSVIKILDYLYLGVDRPKCLSQYLFGVGVKTGRG